MKMAFLVICPGSFQYNGERERERGMNWGERETAERVERKNRDRERGIRQVNGEQKKDREKSFHRV